MRRSIVVSFLRWTLLPPFFKIELNERRLFRSDTVGNSFR